MVLSVSWRNIWRNPVRSLVIISATAIGMFAGVFSAAFVKGWMNQRLEAGVETEFSYLQLHNGHFLDNYDLAMQIGNGVEISNKILSVNGVDGTSPRIVLQAMASSAETGTGVRILGIDPEREKTTSNLYTFVKEGTYFENGGKNQVVIGNKLAERLKVKLHSKIVVTMQDAQGNITHGAFRICGIYNTSNNMYEELYVFVRYSDLCKLTLLPEGIAHEITVHLSDKAGIEKIRSEIKALNPGYDVKTWMEISPELGYMIEIGDFYSYIFIIVILLALGFGIVNTMLMVVLERVKELGMLMAVGMNKTRVFLMLMSETVMLTITGGIIGIVAGVVAYLATRNTGIDLSMYSQGLEGMGYSAVIKPALETRMVVVIGILVFMTGILASVYPARKALKYNPAEALRIDM